MKQILSIISILFIFNKSNAQLSKNNWLVGGSGSFYSYNEDYTTPNMEVTAKYTSIDLSTSVGYFFIDKFSAGIRPYFSSFKGKSSGGGITNYYRLAVGPFARYYFLNDERPFNLLADAGYQFGINKDYGDRGKFNVFSLMGGTEVFFNTTAGLEILFGYNQKIISIENSLVDSKSNKRGFQISIGFTLHLEKD